MEVDLPSTLNYREKELDILYKIINQDDCEPLPECVFIYGPKSTGKTTLISNLIENCPYRTAFINCIECYTPKLLFEQILNKITGHEISPANNYTSYAKCDKFITFVKNLIDAARTLLFQNDSFLIVLDNVDDLSDNDPKILSSLLHLGELTNLSISFILISEIPQLNLSLHNRISIEIHFQQYSRDELLELMAQNKQEDEFPSEFYRNYLNMFLSIFYRSCRDLKELDYMAQKNFIKYCEPINKKEVDIKDTNKLWYLIMPHLKSNLHSLYCRTSTNVQNETNSVIKNALSFELPYYSKYLLIAAYLASYNPEKSDKRIFLKGSEKRGRKLKLQLNNKSNLKQTLLGPKDFTMDRLLAIFYAIVECNVSLTANLLLQISSLVQLRLLLESVSRDRINGVKFKCAVNLEFISTIAKTIGFNITKYIYENN